MPQYRPTLDGYLSNIQNQTKVNYARGRRQLPRGSDQVPPDNNQEKRFVRTLRDNEGQTSTLNNTPVGINTANDVSKYYTLLGFAALGLVWMMAKKPHQ